MVPLFLKRTLPFLILLFGETGCGTTDDNYLYKSFPANPPYGPTREKLWEKAHKFEENLDFFIAPQGHLIYYRVNPKSKSPKNGDFGNLADCPFWTGALITAEVFRYQVTGSEKALKRARQLLQGLHLLFDVSNRPGLLARAVDLGRGRNPYEGNHPDWRQGEGKFSKYRYKGDVSKDQYIGALVGYFMAYTYLPLSGKEKEEIRKRVLAVANFLLNHEFQIIDIDGQATTFGDLRPRIYGIPIYLNGLFDFFLLLFARRLDPQNLRYQKAFEHFIRWKYHRILKFSKFQFLGNTNPNNDNMAFFCYLGLMHLLKKTQNQKEKLLKKEVEKSMDYVWTFVKAEGNSFWNFIYCGLRKKYPKAIQDGIWNLKLYPPTTKGYSVDHRHIAEIERRFWPGRKGKIQSKYALPLPMRGMSSFIWKSSPYDLYAPDTPGIVYSGTDYLIAYWLGRYYGFIAEKD